MKCDVNYLLQGHASRLLQRRVGGGRFSTIWGLCPHQRNQSGFAETLLKLQLRTREICGQPDAATRRGTRSMTLSTCIQENAKVLQYLKYALRLKEKPLRASVDEPHAEKTNGPSMK